MRIDNHGVGLEVDVDGPADGPPVLLLHGISSCSRTSDFDRDKGAALFDEHAVAIVATSPTIEVVRITGVGHLIHDSQTRRGRYLDEVGRVLDTYAPA